MSVVDRALEHEEEKYQNNTSCAFRHHTVLALGMAHAQGIFQAIMGTQCKLSKWTRFKI